MSQHRHSVNNFDHKKQNKFTFESQSTSRHFYSIYQRLCNSTEEDRQKTRQNIRINVDTLNCEWWNYGDISLFLFFKVGILLESLNFLVNPHLWFNLNFQPFGRVFKRCCLLLKIFAKCIIICYIWLDSIWWKEAWKKFPEFWNPTNKLDIPDFLTHNQYWILTVVRVVLSIIWDTVSVMNTASPTKLLSIRPKEGK